MSSRRVHARIIHAALTLAIAVLAVLVPSTAYAAPAFKAPFACGESWTASTYGGHSDYNRAVDFNYYPSDLGKPVLASGPGTARSIWDSAGGNMVIVDHGGGWVTWYAHLQSVSINNPITVGEQIGTVGATGQAVTAPHLHFEQRLNGVAQPVAFDGNVIPVGTSYTASDPKHTSTNCGTVAPGEGQFVSHGGHVYRIAGGAPIYVSTWDRFGGPQPTTPLSDAQFNALPTYPRNGTLISGQAPGHPDHGTVYRIAGGAPLYVSSFDRIGGNPGTIGVDLSAIHNAGGGSPWNHLRYFPGDGTLISGQAPGEPDHGTVYRIVGGAPLYVSNYSHIGGDSGTVSVDLAAIHNAGGGGRWSHLRWHPADGTLISGRAPGHPEDGTVYRIAGGAPVYVSNYDNIGGDPGTVTVDLAAIHNAGGGGRWGHLRWSPSDGALVTISDGSVLRFAGGAPIAVSSWDNIGGRPPGVPVTRVDHVALAKAGAGSVWNHVSFHPVDGTILDANGSKYEVRGGAPYATTTAKPGVRIDPVAIQRAGQAGLWAHLNAPVTAPTTVVPQPEPVPAPVPVTAPLPVAAPDQGSVAADERRLYARAARQKSILVVRIGPASASVDHDFTVQRRTSTGRWKTVVRKSTKGTRDVRKLDLRRGVYRVVVAATADQPALKSRRIRLKR